MPKKRKPFWSSVTRAVFPKLKLQDAHDPRSFIGREVYARPELDAPDEALIVRDIRGCAAITGMDLALRERLIKHYQINGTHYCHMFSFHTQMEEGRIPSDEELAEFELATNIKSIRSTDKK